MTWVLQGFGHLIQGKSMMVKYQHDEIHAFYYGKLPNRPSQIEMQYNGIAEHCNLYDSS